MGKQSDLSTDEKSKIIIFQDKVLTRIKFQKKTIRIVKMSDSFVNNPNRNRKRSEKGKIKVNIRKQINLLMKSI